MRLAGLIIAACTLLAVPASAAAAKPPAGDYIGETEKNAIGVALDRGGVLAYVCDGDEIGSWFKGSGFKGSKLVLRNGSQRLTLNFSNGKLRARFRDSSARLRRAKGKPGLYRSENTINGKRTLGGWIVQRSGEQVGVIQTGSQLAPAPQLSTTTLTAGSLVAGPVLSPADPLSILVDLDGDGLDPTGTVTTSLLGGGSRTVNWTRPGDDDAFVALDAAALKAKGYTLSVSGRVLVRGGIKVTRGSSTTTATDGFHLLRLLDGNGDGILSPADPAWEAALLFADRNANGIFGDSAGNDMVAAMAELNMEFLALQAAVQAESRKFQTLSNASKARHNIAMNAIRNLK